MGHALFLQSPVECVSPISKAWSLSFAPWLSPLLVGSTPSLQAQSQEADHSASASTAPGLQCALRKADSTEELRTQKLYQEGLLGSTTVEGGDRMDG